MKTKRILFFVVYFFIGLLFSLNSFAAVPSINGCDFLGNGLKVTVTGLNFGAKPPSSQVLFEQFEDNASNGQDINAFGVWDKSSSDAKYDSSFQRHKYSKFNIKNVLIKGGLNGRFRKKIFAADSIPKRIYLSFWSYTNVNNNLSLKSWQHKLWRLTAGSEHGDYPQIACSNWENPDESYYQKLLTLEGTTGGSISGLVYVHKKWINTQLIVRESSGIDVADGAITIRLLRDDGYVMDKTKEGIATRTAQYPDVFSWIHFGYYISNNISDGHEVHTYWDDIYINDSWNRVEIGNKSVYGSCTHLEIQPVVSWGGDQIQILANQGSFNDGDSAYLFVVDANGNVSKGYGPITIGSGGVSVPTPTDNPPTVSITSPTSTTSYTSSENAITISGTASDDKVITGITWANSSGGSGNVIDSAGDWSKFFADISLKEGANDITVKATDSNNKTSTDTLAITYNSDNIAQSWSAIKQTADSNWKDSGVTYCVRLLIEGAHITQPGGHIILGFKGRISGDYKIRKVSIAERDVNSSVGNVVDSTWARVTFDGKSSDSWELDEAVVLAGTEKQSDPVSFSIQPGKDYYITFKIVSPSVYLNPPSSYRELYFWDADHASDIDWSGNGHSLTQDYHALSSIYVISNTDLLPPRDVTNVGHSRDGNQLTFTWTNPKSTENGTVIPENKDFAGVMIRYNTGKDVLPPASHTEGTLFCDKHGNLDSNDSCTNSIGLGQDYSFSLFTYDSSSKYSHTVYVTVDANPPGVIKNFAASSGDKQVTLSWTNPSDQDYAGTVVRYGTGAYPSNEKDGSLAVDKKGTPSGNSSFIHGSLQNALKYYYSAFAYDPSGNYSQAVNVSQTPSLPGDTIPPAPPVGTVVQ